MKYIKYILLFTTLCIKAQIPVLDTYNQVWTTQSANSSESMQEMLLQESNGKIYLFPAWPKDWNVHFKLYASQNTTVEVEILNGELKIIKVLPKEREKDIINLLGKSTEEKIKLN